MDKIIQLKIYSPQGVTKASMPEGTFSVGRSDTADYKIDNNHLSRKHLSIKSHDNKIYVCDLGTTNGSYLNGRRLVANQWYEVNEDDRVKLGLSELFLQISLVQDNVVDFKSKKEDATRAFEIPSPSSSPAHNIDSNLAVDFERTQLIQTEQALNRQIDDIQARVQDIATPKLSEVEMLQIKKLEIDSKVAAIKIKEDAEKLANKLIEDATYKANNIEADSLKKVEDQTKQINELKIQINELNDRIFKLNEQLSESNLELEQLRNTNDDLISEIEKNESKLAQLKDQYVSLQEKIEFEQESHNMVIQKKIADAKSLEEDKQTIQAEIEQCLQQKEEIEHLIEQSKEHEKAAQENYHKTQERVDKIYAEKDQIGHELNQLKSEVQSLEQQKKELDKEIQSFRKQIEQEISEHDQTIQQKQILLADIEKQIAEDFKEQRQELMRELEQIEKENQAQKAHLQAEKEAMAKAIIDEANNSAQEIINEAKQIANDLDEQTKAKILDFEQHQKRVLADLDDKQKQLEKQTYQVHSELKDYRELAERETKEYRERAQAELEKLQKDAKLEAQQTIDKAIKEYEITLVRAKEKAEQLTNKAKEEAKEFFDAGKEEFEKAQAKSNELLQSAQDKVIQIHKEGLRELEEQKKNLEEQNRNKEATVKELDESIVNAKSDLDTLKQSLDLERQKLRDEIKDEKEKTIADAQSQAKKIRDNLEKEVSITKAQLEKDRVQSIQQAQAEIERIQKAEEIKFQTKLREEKNMLTKMRAKEIESLKQLREQEETAIQNSKKESAAHIAKGIENLVTLKLKKLAGPQAQKLDIAGEAESIRKLVYSSLTNQKAQDKAFFKMLNPYGAFGAGKSTQLMKRLGIGTGVLLALVTVHFIFPKFYPSIYTTLTSVIKVENSAKDLYLEDVKERRSNRPKFNPDMSAEFKSSGLADNILYTNDFAQIWLSDRFQTAWSIKVDEIIVYKLQLPDERVVQYIAQEFKTIRSLQNLRDSIKPETQEDQIKQLKLLEKQGLTNLANILDGEENLRILQAEQEKFFNKFKK